MNKYDFERKEWLNPDTIEFSNDYEKALYQKHLKPYHIVKNELNGLNVLEIGCGAGYGLEIIHSYAEMITTVDIDESSLTYAQNKYDQPNINFIHADILEGIKFEDNSFDYVISFQVIEHFTHKNVKKYLSEIQRVLKPGGKAFFTTPNRNTRLLPGQKPINTYHPTEYSKKSLERLLNKTFESVEIFGLKSSSEIEAMFFTRKNQTYFRAFILKPIRNLIYNISRQLKLKSIKNILDKRSKYSRPKKQFKDQVIDENQFFVVTENIDNSIDLYARCNN